MKVPIDYSKYPPDWKNIRLTRLAIAGEQHDRYGKVTKEARCEQKDCYVQNHQFYHRMGPETGNVILCPDRGGLSQNDTCAYCWEVRKHAPVAIQIILTIAHLDHDPENFQVCIDRLRAWCQKCHLGYDRPMRRIQRDRKAGQLFLVEPTFNDIG